MAKKYQLEQLDDATQDYLRAVRDRQGVGMPGLFAPRSFYLPIIGLISGIVVIIGVLILTLPPLELTPMKAALLQTAGLLLGGWMIVAAVRVWASAGSRRYLGHFVYADALTLYDVAGSTVTVVDLLGLHSANGVDNFNEGRYQSTSIELYLEKGQKNLSLNNQEYARRLIVFLNGLAFIRSQGTGELQNQSPAALSEMARRLADGERTGGEYRAGQVESEFATLPVPQKTGRPSSGLIAYSVILALTVLGVIVLQAINGPLRDDAMFELVMYEEPGFPVRPPALRFYLLHYPPRDPGRHTNQVLNRLARLYEDPPAPHLQGVLPRLRTFPGRDETLGPAFVELASTLKTAVEPVISIRVKEERKDDDKANVPDGTFDLSQVKQREEQTRKHLVDGLTNVISDGTSHHHQHADPKLAGQEREDMVAFVEVPTDVKPLFEVIYRVSRNPVAGEGPYLLEWTVNIRKTPDAPPVSKTWTSPRSWNNWELVNGLRDEVRRTLDAVGGRATAEKNPGF